MSTFDSIMNVNTMEWFDGEDNQHQNSSSGNMQLPNSTSSFSPLILDLMNNRENESRLEPIQLQQVPDLPVFDDIDILTYLMQADNGNTMTSQPLGSGALQNIISGRWFQRPL